MKNMMFRVLSLLLVLMMVCSFAAVPVWADENEQAAVATTETTENKDAEDDLSLTDTYEVFCENDHFAMSFSKEGMFLLITDKRTGKKWYSTPPGVWSSQPAVNKPERMSLITVTYTDKSSNENYAYSYTKSVKKNGATLEPIKEGGKVVGAKIVFKFISECFTVPVTIRLTDNGIDFSVLYNEIVAEPFSNLGITYNVTKVAVMPFFGAVEQGKEGYAIIPDGCGALVDFQQDNGTINCDYTEVMYGRDASKAIKARTNFKEMLTLPVYGIKDGNAAFTAIVTEGDGRSELFYRVAGVKSSYNNVYFNFVYNDGDTVTAKDKRWDAKSFKIFEPYDLSGEQYTVSYRFNEADKSDYVGMAEVYRNYLMQEKNMTKHAVADYAPLNVELIASIRRPVSVLGFPVNKVVPLADYADVRAIHGALKEKGVTQILFDYKNWYKGSQDKKIPANVKADGALGSEKELRELNADLQKDGTSLYANFDFVNLRTSGNGYHKKNSATRSMDKQPAMLFQFNPATFQAYTTETDQRKVTYLLSPIYYEEATKRALNAFTQKDYGFTGISDSDLCATLYSDYGKKEYERLEAEGSVENSLKTLASATNNLLLNAPLGYTLPYATYISNAPIQNSNFYSFTRTVPFYQLVIQGVVNNATTVMNDEADIQYELLKAIETGSAIKVRWTAQNIKMIDQTMYDNLMDTDYTLWIDEVAEKYNKVAPLLRKVSDQTITAHTYLAENVTKTTFANGVSVIVNYNHYDVTVDGVTVAARDYQEGRA